MKTNRNYKDSVFTKLFSDPDLLRDLYRALGDVTLPNDAPVSINTLENVLYMDFFNDISFMVNGKLVVLIEHQSTINPNMALRMFFYISKVLEKMIKRKGLYTGKLLKIPRPEFYVLYNGKKPYPDEIILKLSDLFEEPLFPEKTRPLLELEVKVLNINEGKNKETVKRCKILEEYSIFVAKVNEYLQKFNDKEKAIEEAIKYCVKNDILREFLETHGSEVLNMLLEEWNIDDAKEVWQEEAREEGREEGLMKGREESSLTIARNLLLKGSTLEFVQEITGLDPETIAKCLLD